MVSMDTRTDTRKLEAQVWKQFSKLIVGRLMDGWCHRITVLAVNTGSHFLGHFPSSVQRNLEFHEEKQFFL